MKIQVLVQSLTNFKGILVAFLKREMDKVCLAIFEARNHFHDQKITMKKSFRQVKYTCNLHSINSFFHKKKNKTSPEKSKLFATAGLKHLLFQFRFTSYFYSYIHITASPEKVGIS